jgi:hypothetical protein
VTRPVREEDVDRLRRAAEQLEDETTVALCWVALGERESLSAEHRRVLIEARGDLPSQRGAWVEVVRLVRASWGVTWE